MNLEPEASTSDYVESRGFAFVTMETSEEADAAIKALNATEQFGKVITVEKVRYILKLCLVLAVQYIPIAGSSG